MDLISEEFIIIFNHRHVRYFPLTYCGGKHFKNSCIFLFSAYIKIIHFSTTSSEIFLLKKMWKYLFMKDVTKTMLMKGWIPFAKNKALLKEGKEFEERPRPHTNFCHREI